MEQRKTAVQVKLGFIAAALFLIAGVIEIVATLVGSAHKTAGHGTYILFPVIGLTFISLGCMWIAIAASWKKKIKDESL
jgi:uncharacterized membrane protein HdeD (DUF308 family)